MILLGETEAGLRGAQPCRGEPGGRIDALKIPARRVEYSLTENALFPFQAEPIHSHQLPTDLFHCHPPFL
jgi:hypothetical protein